MGSTGKVAIFDIQQIPEQGTEAAGLKSIHAQVINVAATLVVVLDGWARRMPYGPS